jgi:hypothetical protein
VYGLVASQLGDVQDEFIHLDDGTAVSVFLGDIHLYCALISCLMCMLSSPQACSKDGIMRHVSGVPWKVTALYLHACEAPLMATGMK